MKKLLIFTLMFTMFVNFSYTNAQATIDTNDTYRNSIANDNAQYLSNFYQKIINHEDVKIGFLGGSITYGAVATPSTNRFSTLLVQRLSDYYATNVIEINAGQGATDSLTGVFRLDQDIISKSPDLVVIDFAVNDGGYLHDEYTAYDSIVHRLLDHNIGVILFYATTDLGQNAQFWQNTIAQHYGIPAISLKDAYYPLVQSGTISASYFLGDTLHPNNTGHAIIADLIFNYITTHSCQNEPSSIDIPDNNNLYGEDFLKTKTSQHGDKNSTFISAKGFTFVEPYRRIIFGGLGIQGHNIGDTYQFKFTGSSIGFLFHAKVDPAFGKVSIVVDNFTPVELNTNQGVPYDNLFSKMIHRGLRNEEHTVKITMVSGSYVQIQAFLIGTEDTNLIFFPVIRR